MKQNILKHWKTTVTGLLTLLIYFLIHKDYISVPFSLVLKESLELILMSLAAIVLTIYAKDKDNGEEQKK